MVTADALSAHADVCPAVQRKPGEYTLYAETNPAPLRADREAAFAAEGGAFPLRASRTVGRAGVAAATRAMVARPELALATLNDPASISV